MLFDEHKEVIYSGDLYVMLKMVESRHVACGLIGYIILHVLEVS